jgi:hypothetical protein
MEHKREKSIILRDLEALVRGGHEAREGKIGYILGWLIGIPIPILLLIFVLRGCN